MTSLTWFLYLTGVLPALATLLDFFTFGGLVTLLTYSCVALLHNGDLEVRMGERKPLKLPRINVYIFLVALGVVSCLIPDRVTMLSMLASEVGQEAAVSDVGQELLLDVKEIVQHQLDQLKGTSE